MLAEELYSSSVPIPTPPPPPPPPLYPHKGGKGLSKTNATMIRFSMSLTLCPAKY